MALSQPSKINAVLSRLRPLFIFEISKGSTIEDVGRAQFSTNNGECSGSGQEVWRKVDSRRVGIKESMISTPSWMVLKKLQASGFEAYLVGGCVRDLLLNRVPKDFDVITTAQLKQVKSKFPYAVIVGRRFPICMVKVKGSTVEVSSFNTETGKSERNQFSSSPMSKGCDPRDLARWKNCLKRDFTVNSLFFDPFVNIIFDYTNAMEDLRSRTLKTVIPAHVSFKEDEARILRGLRLAARLNLSFSKETESAIYSLSSSITRLCKSRLHLEINYMLSYGAAERSLLLLQRFKLLEILLPFHAAYISEQVANGCGPCSVMLMELFFSMDQLVTCARPSYDSLWVAILTFHLALFSKPQHAVVVLTFAALLYHETWEDSIKFARQNALATRIYVPEILDTSQHISDDEIAERVTQFVQQVEKSINVLTNMNCLVEAMTRFPDVQRSGLVFVSQRMGQRIRHIFHILAEDVTSIKANRRSSQIDYRSLASGYEGEIRFVLGKIILSTLLRRTESGATKVKKDGKQKMNPPQKSGALEQIQPTSFHHGKSTDKKRKPPSNYQPPHTASKTLKVTQDRLSGIMDHACSHSRRHNSHSDEYVKADEVNSKGLLSGLFR